MCPMNTERSHPNPTPLTDSFLGEPGELLEGTRTLAWVRKWGRQF